MASMRIIDFLQNGEQYAVKTQFLKLLFGVGFLHPTPFSLPNDAISSYIL